MTTVLAKMGFGGGWIQWIRWCISTASFSVLINGSPHGFFHSSKSLRHGDHLSTYLFVIVVEAFGQMIEREVDGEGWWGVKVFHLLFSDDILIFCEDSQEQFTYLCWFLMWFETLLRLRINLEKSELYPIGSVGDVEALAVVLGCKVGSLPTTYDLSWFAARS